MEQPQPSLLRRITNRMILELRQNDLEVQDRPAVQTPFKLPDLTVLEPMVTGPEGISGMSGHVLFLFNLVWQLNAQVVVEIGLGTGNSSSVFLLALKETGGQLYSIDIEPKPIAEQKIEQSGLGDRWHFIHKPSELVPANWPNDRPIDILLLDGKHSYNQLKQEFRGFKPHMKPGGYMLFHDSETIRGVRKFTRTLRKNGVQFPFSNGLFVYRV